MNTSWAALNTTSDEAVCHATSNGRWAWHVRGMRLASIISYGDGETQLPPRARQPRQMQERVKAAVMQRCKVWRLGVRYKEFVIWASSWCYSAMSTVITARVWAQASMRRIWDWKKQLGLLFFFFGRGVMLACGRGCHAFLVPL
jgi:hypothetical protein